MLAWWLRTALVKSGHLRLPNLGPLRRRKRALPCVWARSPKGHVWTYMDPARLQQIGWIRLLVTTADVYPAS